MSVASGVSAAVTPASRNAIRTSFTKTPCATSIVIGLSSIATTPARTRAEYRVESAMFGLPVYVYHVDMFHPRSYAISCSNLRRFSARHSSNRHFPPADINSSGSVGRNQTISSAKNVAKLSSPVGTSANQCANVATGRKSRKAERLSSPSMRRARGHVGESIQTAHTTA